MLEMCPGEGDEETLKGVTVLMGGEGRLRVWWECARGSCGSS